MDAERISGQGSSGRMSFPAVFILLGREGRHEAKRARVLAARRLRPLCSGRHAHRNLAPIRFCRIDFQKGPSVIYGKDRRGTQAQANEEKISRERY